MLIASDSLSRFMLRDAGNMYCAGEMGWLLLFGKDWFGKALMEGRAESECFRFYMRARSPDYNRLAIIWTGLLVAAFPHRYQSVMGGISIR